MQTILTLRRNGTFASLSLPEISCYLMLMTIFRGHIDTLLKHYISQAILQLTVQRWLCSGQWDLSKALCGTSGKDLSMGSGEHFSPHFFLPAAWDKNAKAGTSTITPWIMRQYAKLKEQKESLDLWSLWNCYACPDWMLMTVSYFFLSEKSHLFKVIEVLLYECVCVSVRACTCALLHYLWPPGQY